MNNARRFQVVERFAKPATKKTQILIHAPAPLTDHLNARGKVLRMAFKPKLQPSGQVFLAELLAGLPVVQGVAIGREQRHEARIEPVSPMALVNRLAGVLKGVVYQM